MSLRSRSRGRLTALAFALLPAAACAPAPTPGAPEPRGGVPGFDTREFPGSEAMSRWRESSPYRWVGYYLPAPCHTGTSWVGQREALRAAGWGLAVIFLGEQDWGEAERSDAAAAARPSVPDTIPPPLPDTIRAAEADTPRGEPRCTSANLSEVRGRRDAASADSAVSAEGFPSGTVVYLDVERVESVSDSLAAYVSSWATALLERGRFVPGLYAHERNVGELLPLIAAALEAAGRPGAPRLWVARPQGFDLSRTPADSGFPEAWIWQGLLDTHETWGGVTLRIDANVATTADPSG